MSLNGGMYTENVIYYTMEYYSAIKNNEFMKFLGKMGGTGKYHPK